MNTTELEVSKALKIPSRLNLYDTLAYMLVGISCVLLMRFDLTIIGHPIDLPEVTLANIIVWLAVYYFLGTTIQEIARLVFKYILRFRVKFTPYDETVLEDLKLKLKLKTTTMGETYKICYLYARARDVTGHVDLFHALYALYRGWVILFFAELVFIGSNFYRIHNMILYASLAALLTALFYIRCRYFYLLVKERILHTFLVIEKNPHSDLEKIVSGSLPPRG